MPRKLVESTFVTLDGVIGSPQNWSPPYWDEEHAAYSQSLMKPAEALLLGRATYEGFAQAWPPRHEDWFDEKINAMPKYVASRTLKSAEWNASIIDGDLAEAVKELKAGSGGDLLKYGTGEVDRTLAEHRLVDEYHFWMFPVVAGDGTRLSFNLDATHLQLLATTTFKSGIVVLKYGPK